MSQACVNELVFVWQSLDYSCLYIVSFSLVNIPLGPHLSPSYSSLHPVLVGMIFLCPHSDSVSWLPSGFRASTQGEAGQPALLPDLLPGTVLLYCQEHQRYPTSCPIVLRCVALVAFTLFVFISNLRQQFHTERLWSFFNDAVCGAFLIMWSLIVWSCLCSCVFFTSKRRLSENLVVVTMTTLPAAWVKNCPAFIWERPCLRCSVGPSNPAPGGLRLPLGIIRGSVFCCSAVWGHQILKGALRCISGLMMGDPEGFDRFRGKSVQYNF